MQIREMMFLLGNNKKIASEFKFARCLFKIPWDVLSYS